MVKKKRCKACGKLLPATSKYFWRNGKGKLKSICRYCQSCKDHAFKTVEYHLFHYFDERAEMTREIEAVLGPASPNLEMPFEDTGLQSDITAATAQKIEQIESKYIWVKIIDELMDRLEKQDKETGTKIARLVQKKYFEELGKEHICADLDIKPWEFTKWRKEAINQGIFLACKYECFNEDDVKFA